MKYCLDAWAVVAWLEGSESAAARIDEVLAAERPHMNWINLGEVFYLLQRRQSLDEARRILRRLRPALTLEVPPEGRILEAATIKAKYAVAYADAFAVATAIAHGAVLLTGDPEILAVDAGWPVEDLR